MILQLKEKQIKIVYIAIIALCFTPIVSAPIALALGLLLSLLGIKHSNIQQNTSLILKASIVLMGFGMNLTQVFETSKEGFVETFISVISVMIMGLLLTHLLKLDKKTGLLITSGTAICGGSAIAAVSGVINAKNNQISFALAVVFILNAIALFLFPAVGHYFELSQHTFGQWAAIAIHDTSSVVGAGAGYGDEALQVATTIKLIRALWIIPLSVIIAFMQKNTNSHNKVKVPVFILLFVVAILTSHFVPVWHNTFLHLNWLGKQGMVVSLLLIGSSISVSEAKEVGMRSFVMGISLWFFISVGSLFILR